LVCPKVRLLRPFQAIQAVGLSELGTTSDISGNQGRWFVRTWRYFGHFRRSRPLVCPNMVLLRTFQVISAVGLSEHEATSDISGDTGCWFVRTWGCFGHFRRSKPLVCPNMKQLQTFQAIPAVGLSEHSTTSDISTGLASCFVRTRDCFGHFKRSPLFFSLNMGRIRLFSNISCCFYRTWSGFESSL
jgi:hypothetical protein